MGIGRLMATATVLALLVLCPASRVRAQELAPGARERGPSQASGAREAELGSGARERGARFFRLGLAAVEAEEWSEASAAFESAYALRRDPVILLNLATAQAHSGSLMEAIETYRRFLRMNGPGPELRHAASAAISGVEGRLARVSLSVPDLRSGDALRLDQQLLAHAQLGEMITLDPGSHRLRLLRGGAPIAEESFSLEEGEFRELSLHARIQSLGVLESPWFWVVAGALLVGGAVAGAWLATRDGDEWFVGNVDTGHWTLPP